MSSPGDGDRDKDKYHRLAAEYSKLKSYLNVLKKGILDEQAKNAELKELLRERELNIRKSELEIDSLNFRNQQLTKRVTVLQEDIESLQSHKNSKKTKHKKDERNVPQTSSVSSDFVIQEELQKKIIENAQLVSQMADKDFQLSQMKSRISDSDKQISEMESKHKNELSKWKIQNQELVNSLENALNFKERSSLNNQGTPSKIYGSASQTNQMANGDFISEVGSLIGSEDALSTEESHLTEQLRKKNEVLIKVEQDYQTLRIEYDLLKLEMESLKSNPAKNVEEPKPNRDANIQSETSENTTETLVGKMVSPLLITDEISARENSFKTYFRDKISMLITERQQCESMTRYYEDENDGLQNQIDFLKKEKNVLEEGISSNQSTINKLEDELHSTSTNYEQQVILLSEHVGNLNDKLAMKAEEIQHLKEKLSSKK